MDSVNYEKECKTKRIRVQFEFVEYEVLLRFLVTSNSLSNMCAQMGGVD